MPREVFEFHCTECFKYFDIKLNTNLNGSFRIHCPNCNHIHYRSLNNGNITSERFSNNKDKDSDLFEDIFPMKSCCRDIQKEKHEECTFDGNGFLKRLWKSRFSGVTQ